VLAELQPSRDHLNSITKLWRQWKPLPRTTLPKERLVTINLRAPNEPQIYEVTVPDASGEAFRRIFETRRCSSDFETLAVEACAIMLFIHPNKAIPPERIDISVDKMSDTIDAAGDENASALDDMADTSEVQSAELPPGPGKGSEIAAQVANTGESDRSEQAAELKWNPKYSAYQAKLVDLLQISRRFRGPGTMRLAVVVSAWDLCEVERLEPLQWIQARLPLLYQYLSANHDVCPFDVYGVSAQGAELKKPGDLLNAIRSSDRIKVVHGASISKDLTLPIKQLLFETAGTT
jgi:hypothetical protein